MTGLTSASSEAPDEAFGVKRLPLLSLRTIILAVMISVLILPLGAAYLFRMFENELVRQTEQELIAQSAVLSATFLELIRPNHLDAADNAGSLPVKPYSPVFPRLNLYQPFAPPRPDAVPAPGDADPVLLLAAERMNRVMAETQIVTLAGLRLVDSRGRVLAGREERGLSLAHVPEVREALDGRYSSVIRERIPDGPLPPIYSISRGTNIRVFTAFPITHEGRILGAVYLSRTPESIVKRLYDNRVTLAVIGSAMLGMTLLLGLLVSWTIAVPIRQLLLQVEKVRSNEQRTIEPLSHPITRELASLSDSFAAMSRSLTERNEYILRFASHVSHEFKTPLTALQGALELLRDHEADMQPQQREKFLANLQSDTQRLKHLVSRLLELARADALVPAKGLARLEEVVRRTQSRFRDRGLEIVLEQCSQAEVPMAPDALEIVMANLVENSLLHGATKVAIRHGHELGEYRVRDNGSGVPPANRDRIFTPFFTTRRHGGGTGLGLEICRSILKAYGATIALADEQPLAGAEFVLHFSVQATHG
jgi:signal transduction histidine kinase